MTGAAVRQATLVRSDSGDQGTFGVLSFGGHRVQTLELPWRNNQPQISCIPPDAYECALVQSPKFGRVYWVRDVPGRASVLIHPANLGGDTACGYDTQLQGCIAPFERSGLMRNSKGQWQRAGLLSRPALRALMDWAQGFSFVLEVKNATHISA